MVKIDKAPFKVLELRHQPTGSFLENGALSDALNHINKNHLLFFLCTKIKASWEDFPDERR